MGCMAGKAISSSSLPDQQTPHLKQQITLSSAITCMTLSEDLSMLVLGSEDGVLHVWSALSSPVESLAQLKGHCVSRKGNRVPDSSLIFPSRVSGEHHLLSLAWSLPLLGIR